MGTEQLVIGEPVITMQNISSFVHIFINILVVGFIVAFSCSILSIILDIWAMHRERLRGKYSVWYQRPTIMAGIGLLLMLCAVLLNMLFAFKLLTVLLLWQEIVLLVIGVIFTIYALVLRLKAL